MITNLNTYTMLYLKKAMIIVVMALSAPIFANAQMKIAVMDFKAGVGVSQGDVDGISAIFGTYFMNPEKFTLVERTQINRVVDEQGFQLSSLTQLQMVRIGQILNLSKIVVGDINVVGGQYNVDVRAVNVETGAVEATDGATWASGTSYRDLMKNMANRLMAQMSSSTTTSASSQTPTTVVTLLGYLHVYPSDLGIFSSIPFNVISQLNKQGAFGYDTWRVPTTEELALMKANGNMLALTVGNTDYITSNGTRSGIVRLVTTDYSIDERRETEMSINGVIWATRNVDNRGVFVANVEGYGNFFTYEEAQKACPDGWRTPSIEEFKSLVEFDRGYVESNGVIGRVFVHDTNWIFLPAAGFRDGYDGTVKIQDIGGAYWSRTPYKIGGIGHNLGFVPEGIESDAHFGNAYGLSVRCVKK